MRRAVLAARGARAPVWLAATVCPVAALAAEISGCADAMVLATAEHFSKRTEVDAAGAREYRKTMALLRSALATALERFVHTAPAPEVPFEPQSFWLWDAVEGLKDFVLTVFRLAALYFLVDMTIRLVFFVIAYVRNRWARSRNAM